VADPREVLVAKQVRGDCEACGRNDWHVAEDRYALVVADPVSDLPLSALTAKGMNALLMFCGSCGYVRLFLDPVPSHAA
jgi:hypothetical protein